MVKILKVQVWNKPDGTIDFQVVGLDATGQIVFGGGYGSNKFDFEADVTKVFEVMAAGPAVEAPRAKRPS